MKLKFKSQYMSIKQFENIQIEDFTVLTGMNGSGKTHLLNAIKRGNVEIEGVEKSEIVYYNYNDFTVFAGNLQQNPTLQNRLTEWTNEKNQFIQKIQQFKNTALQTTNKALNSTDQIIFGYTQQPNYDFETLFGNHRDFELLDEIKDKPDIQNLLNVERNKFSQPFFNFIYQYLFSARGQIDDLTLDKLKNRFLDSSKQLEYYLKEQNEDLFYFLKRSVRDKNIFSINETDFESPNLYLEDIANEEKEYQLLKTQNILNKSRALEYDEQIVYLTTEDFFKKYGKSPVEQINDVLKEYDCNGYSLITNSNQSFLGVDIKNIKIPINLIHKEEKYTTTFEQLSSGEKTLIALALLIYKTKKNRIIPRVLLLDEIDSSLHPSMITRLLTVIQKLFIKEQGFKVIIATHSPTTVALSPENSIYTISKCGSVKIKKEKKSIAIDILTDGFATFNDDETNLSIEYNIKQTNLPIIFTEGITDKIILETAWKKLYNNQMPFFIQDCFDASFLGNLFRRGYDGQDGIFTNYSDRKMIALFDFDKQGYSMWDNIKKDFDIVETNPEKSLTKTNKEKNAYIMLLPVPNNEDIRNQVIKTGFETFKHESSLTIELLFYGVTSLEKFFIEESIKGGGEIVSFIGNKREFAKTLNNLNRESFVNVIPLFAKISEIINTNA